MVNLRDLVFAGSLGLAATVESLGVAHAGDAHAADLATDTAYDSIDEMHSLSPDATSKSFEKGFSVVLIYGSRPTTEGARKQNATAVEFYVDVANHANKTNVSYYTFDTQLLADRLGTTDAVTQYLESNFGVRKRPSMVMYCAGNPFFELDSAVPNSETWVQARDFVVNKINTGQMACQ